MKCAGGRKKRFETVLPEGYVPVYTLDAADKRVGLRLNAAALVVMALVAAIGWWGIRPTELAAHYSLWHSLLLIGGMLLYLVLHELLHGAAYKLLTRRRLTFGMTATVAFCGVPDIYVYRRTALIALLTPFAVFIPVFLLPACLCAQAWDRFGCVVLLAIHLGGCVGDLYDAGLYWLRFRRPDTLMQDTGPKQTFYVKGAESTTGGTQHVDG